MSQVRVEIPSSDFEVLGRLYCKHCYFEHWVDLRRCHVDDEIDLLFDFNHDHHGNFFWERLGDIRRRFLKRKPLEETVDVVSMDWWQLNEVFALLGGNIKQDLPEPPYPEIKWDITPGVKTGDAMIFESDDFFFSIEVVSTKGKCYLYDFNFGWKLPRFSLRDHLRHLRMFLFNNYEMYFYRYEAALDKKQSNELLGAMKFAMSLVRLDDNQAMVFKSNPPNMPEED